MWGKYYSFFLQLKNCVCAGSGDKLRYKVTFPDYNSKVLSERDTGPAWPHNGRPFQTYNTGPWDVLYYQFVVVTNFVGANDDGLTSCLVPVSLFIAAFINKIN